MAGQAVVETTVERNQALSLSLIRNEVKKLL